MYTQRPYRHTHVGDAVGNLIVKPNSVKHVSRLLVYMGMRDPRQVMHRAHNLQNAEYLYFIAMAFTGQIALLCAGGGSVGFKQDGQLFDLGLVVVALAWLYGLRVAHGYLLYAFTKDLPDARRFYTYRWYWPLTLRTSLKVTRLPHVIFDKERKAWDRFLSSTGIVLWALFIKLPLYFTVVTVAYQLVTSIV